ncbi:hypothetical protein B7486_59500, partial [cyanobacterium TDX16]
MVGRSRAGLLQIAVLAVLAAGLVLVGPSGRRAADAQPVGPPTFSDVHVGNRFSGHITWMAE